jgi:hypothetical protein
MENKKKQLSKSSIKKIILFLLGIPTAYVLSGIIFSSLIGYQSSLNSKLFLAYTWPLDVLDRLNLPGEMIGALFIMFVFSLITYFLSDRIFRAWRLWTGIWLILFAWVTYHAATTIRGGTLAAYPSVDPNGFIPTYLLYVIVSIIVILVTRWREKRS